MQRKPLISIVIPVFNSEKYLKECLDSVVSQTYDNLEVVIINDGSTDSSLNIIKTYKDKRIKLINKENSGVSSARNVGLKQATGDYLLFIDSDDYLAKNDVLEELINSFNKCDVVKYGYSIDKNNNIKEDSFIQALNDSYITGESFLLDVLNKKKNYGWFLWQYMFKRSLWEGIEFPNRGIFEDLSALFKVLLKADNIFVSKNNIYTYRKNGLSISNNVTFKKCKEYVDAMKESLEYTDSLNIGGNLKSLLKNNFSYGYISELLTVDYLDKEEKKEINKILAKNKSITNNIIYGKEKYIIVLVNIFGLNFVELLLSIRNKIKQQ